MKIYSIDNFKFTVDKSIEDAFKEIIIEYTDGWFKKGFVVRVKQ